MKKSYKNTITYILLLLIITLTVIFYFLPINIFEAEKLNGLFKNLILQSITLVLLLYIVIKCGYSNLLKVRKGKKPVILIIFAFLVAAINFPFYSLIAGKAEITDFTILPLFLLSCLVTALEEEIFFRGLLYSFVKDKFSGRKNQIILSVVLSSLIFGLFHLFNLLSGNGGLVLLQVFYTFFLGCLLATLKESTGDIYIGLFVHALFNFCGGILNYAGSGEYFSYPLVVTVVIVALITGTLTLKKLLTLNKKVDL